MQRGSDEEKTSEETQNGPEEHPGIGSRLRGAIGATGERVTGTTDTITGVQFRRQFEDFTDAVTTAVVGVHRDQADLRERVNDAVEGVHRGQSELRQRMDTLQTPRETVRTSWAVWAFGIIAMLALIVGFIALVRTF